MDASAYTVVNWETDGAALPLELLRAMHNRLPPNPQLCDTCPFTAQRGLVLHRQQQGLL